MPYRTVVLVTTFFPSPCITEEAFISPELDALSRHFSRVIIVPLMRGKQRKPASFNRENVTVDYSVADDFTTRHSWAKFPGMFAPSTMALLPGMLRRCGSLRTAASRWTYVMNVGNFRRMIQRINRRHDLNPASTLYYTFWFDYPTDAIAAMSEKHPITVISRAHGYDIYDRYALNRPPEMRRRTLRHLSALYPASQDGADYINAIYPGYAGKISVRILGSEKNDDFMAACNPVESGKITLLSVARISPEKRVDRNVGFAIALASLYPDKRVKWIHVGDGPDADSVKKLISTSGVPDNLSIDMRGALPNDSVHCIYHTEAIDWTMLFSDSEGGCPIAISESLSYGVPIIANKVGGIQEIVTDTTGVAVNAGTTPGEIARRVSSVMENRQLYTDMKKAAAERWRQSFYAPELREKFVEEIASLPYPEK